MTEAPQESKDKVVRSSAYYVFTLLFLLYLFNYVDRMIVTALFPFIQKDWGLSDTQAGALVSVVFGAIVVFTVPAS
ncbi:MAG: hypothetical protein PHN75_10800, partial [Syntrophales bacterium]|nr:hypothetical protein [Syntrophales bacterium]